MGKIKRVMLDLDGCICDFRQGMYDALGRPSVKITRKWSFWKDWPGVTFEMVNAVCTHDFWANLPFTKEGYDIYFAVIQKFGKEQVYFLTTPMPNMQSYSGKLEWLDNHFPGYKKRTIITMTPKSLFAGPDTLLIDDNDDNVSNFYNAGGDAILVPRMWNALYEQSDNALNHVLKKLKEI